MPEHGKTPRVTAKQAKAIRLIVDQNVSKAEAAQRAGMTANALHRALRKDHVRAFWDSVQRERVQAVGRQAVNKLASLMQYAHSEYVQLEAADRLARMAGIGRGDQQAGRPASQQPQIVINLRSDSQGEPVTIDQRPSQPQAEPPVIEHGQRDDSEPSDSGTV